MTEMTDAQLTAVWNEVNGARAPLTTKAIFAFARHLIALERETTAAQTVIAIGDRVVDLVDELGEGEVIDVYANTCCGDEPRTMLVVAFGEDETFDRLPEEVRRAVSQKTV